MANLKNIRTQIKSVKSIQQVTNAMKMVSVAKLRRAQERMEKARPYSKRLKSLIEDLTYDVDRSILQLLNERKTINYAGYLIVTGDRGLAGSFNSNIIKKAEAQINEFGKENAKLFCIGKKGFEYFKKREYNVINHYTDFWADLNYNEAIKIGKDITNSFINHEIDELNVIFNFFKNVGSQKLIYESLLPLSFEKKENSVISDIIYEPSKTEIVKTLIPKYINTEIWKYLLESFASEQAARMIAMESATDSAKEMIDDLKLEFNKARQTAITTEMLEIVGGAEALSN
jgi:F-type H+-transporting ATPase subunit gamma